MSAREVDHPPTDVVSSVRFSPDGSKLLVGSWDSGIHIYTRNSDDTWAFWQKVECDAPILDLCWNADSDVFYAVGLHQEAARHSVSKGPDSRVKLSIHGKASNKIAYSKEHGLVVSTSWDGTMHVHDADSRRFVKVQLPGKPFALSLSKDRAVVAMAERKVWVYDLATMKGLVEKSGQVRDVQDSQPISVDPWQQRESSLKFMTRSIACMPDSAGFAVSSIEGRVGVEWFDPELEKEMYAFKCHRAKQILPGEDGEEDEEVDVVYPVNALAFHPVYGTFATGGGEGSIVVWDPKTKRRLKQLPPLPSSVAAMDFSPDGTLLAIGVSPGFEDGKESEEPDRSLIKVVIREIGAAEAKPKSAKDK